MTDETKQLSLNIEQPQTDNGPVVCLGMTFKNDDERREYFRNELRKKLPELKKIEGFPIADDEDIIALSDPPYYTACPNPWINDFIEEWEKEKVTKYGRDPNEEYHREPFTSDVSEGKSDRLYKLHSYHTKVPHKAVARYILNYTLPGDVILDGFSGTGMTGLAGLLCGDKDFIESLNYTVNEKDEVFNQEGNYVTKLGKRNSILIDLSPIATLITANYNLVSNLMEFKKEADKILKQLKSECEKYFVTYQEGTSKKGHVNYTVWSDVFSCPECTHQFAFWDVAVDKFQKAVKNEFNCPSCNVLLNKRIVNKVLKTEYDPRLKKSISVPLKVPVLINYSVGKDRFDKSPDFRDKELFTEIENKIIDGWYPVDLFMGKEGIWGETWRSGTHLGITHVHHFFNKRTLLVLSEFYKLIKDSKFYSYFQMILRDSTTYSTLLVKVNIPRLLDKGGLFSFGAVTGTLYVPSLNGERNIIDAIESKMESFIKHSFNNIEKKNINISTQDSGDLQFISDESVDYIFVDPPFGSNLMYSELNFIHESWIKVKTNNREEAIINKSQDKDLDDYLFLINKCFNEFYRVLKKGRWITIEFSNSQASVWNAIRQAIEKAGFIIANVSALDKKQGSFKAVTSTIAVKQDLVISAYKPTNYMIEKLNSSTNSSESVWVFVSQHLNQLPIFLGEKGNAEIIVERTPRILFDRMVAYFVQRGLTVPMSSAEFQEGVTQRFPMRDGMAFLESQVAEYDKKRTLVKEFTQLSLFVSDENSAIEWIRQQLIKKPQTRQDLHPEFMKQIQHIAKHEELPELDDLLEQNFLRYDGEEPVPNQILTYLRRNYKDLRGLEPTDPKVIEKAMHRWYVPDPNKQSDLEKLREKALLREFNQYKDELEGNKKKLRTFRTEAIRAGFKNAYKEKDFETIVKIGDRIPEKVIQEDDKLFMFYENAKIRLGL